jgi:hypothetical protein
MAKVSRSGSSCDYMNATRTGDVSISTAKTTRAEAKKAVASTARTVKAKVARLRRVGDRAIVYLTTSKARSVARVLFAKNGNLVFLYVGSPKANHLVPEAVALAKTAARRT